MRLSKGVSLALYISIWFGLIIVAITLRGATFLDQMQEVKSLSENPVEATQNIISRAFSDPTFLTMILGGTVLAGFFISILTGNNFIVIYVVPIVLIFGLLNMFSIPTQTVTGEVLGNETIEILSGDPIRDSGEIRTIQAIFSLFLALLTVLTIFSFISGRN